MNLVNKITCLRILLTIPILIFGSFLNFYSILAGTVLGISTCLLDAFDGYLARKLEMTTDFGIILDPLADKIFSAIVFIFFVSVGMMPFAIVAIILSREIAVCGMRILSAKKNEVIEADYWGKAKTGLQNVTFFFFALVLLHNLYVEDFHTSGIINERFMKTAVLNPLLYLTLALAVISFANYLYKNRYLLRDF